MFRKSMLALCCIAMLVLPSINGPALAKQNAPTFEPVFTPTGFPNEDSLLSGGITQYQSSLYISVSSETSGGQIWRSFDGKSWKPVTDLGFGVDSRYKFSWDMTVFQGKLYVPINCFTNSGPDCPGIILRSANGHDWEQIPLDTQNFALDKLGVYKGMIYATSVWGGGQILAQPNRQSGYLAGSQR